VRRIRTSTSPGFYVFEHQRGCRQKPRVDGAGHPHRNADQAAGFGLEGRAVLVPIDEMRPNQRCEERQNDGNAH